MFEIGQFVVKANTGVCKVVDITTFSSPDGDDEEKLYYNLVPTGNAKAKLFVPVDSSCSNMRCIMSHDEAENLIRRIPEIEVAWISSDRQREQEYKDAIKSNRPEALVSIMKSLYLRNREREEQGKKSTAVDDRYFKMAESALQSELAVALGRETEEMSAVILAMLES